MFLLCSLSSNKFNCEDAVLLAEALMKNQTLRKLTYVYFSLVPSLHMFLQALETGKRGYV